MVFCYRWEAEDDPWQEHKLHSPRCAFVKLNKAENDWKVEDVIKIEVQRQRAIVTKHYDDMINNFKEEATRIREQVVQILK